MKANTAIGLILISIGIWCSALSKNIVASFCAGLAASIGIVTCSEYLFGWDAHIDQLLFRDLTGLGNLLYPGRMSLPTTIYFMGTGVALWFLNRNNSAEKRRSQVNDSIFQAIALLAALWPLQVFVAYSYGRLTAFNAGGSLGYMAPPTAAASLLCVLGILALRTESGFMAQVCAGTFAGSFLRRFLLLLFLAIPALGWVVLHVLEGRERPPSYSVALTVSIAAVLLAALGVWFARTLTLAQSAAARIQEAGEKELRFVTDHAPAFIAHCDNQTRFLFVNRPYALRFNMEPDQIVGKTMVEVLGDKTCRKLQPHVDAVLRGKSVDFEQELPYEKIGARWMRAAYVPDVGADGVVRGFVAVIHDVSASKRAEAALRESEALIRSVTDSAGVGLVLLDKDRRYVFANLAYTKILRLPTTDIIGKRVEDVLAPVYETQIRPRLDKAFAGERVSYELRMGAEQDAEGERIYEVTYEPRTEQPERPGIVVVVISDITDRIHAAEVLEDKVTQRTEELKETVEDLEAFSYSIAHDMRAPLRAMQGFGRILVAEHASQLGSEGQRYLQRIVTAADRLDRLIQDVLNYSKIVRAELSMEPVSTGELLHEILDTYPQFGGLDITVAENMPAVLANKAVLTQIFSNLLGNGVKFVKPEVAPRVRVWAEPVRKAAPEVASALPHMVRIIFQDNGIGIEKLAQKRIFEIFQRLNRSELYEGTGIGLAIVRKGVERMGGKVGLESILGEGSRFWVELQQVNL